MRVPVCKSPVIQGGWARPAYKISCAGIPSIDDAFAGRETLHPSIDVRQAALCDVELPSGNIHQGQACLLAIQMNAGEVVV